MSVNEQVLQNQTDQIDAHAEHKTDGEKKKGDAHILLPVGIDAAEHQKSGAGTGEKAGHQGAEGKHPADIDLGKKLNNIFVNNTRKTLNNQNGIFRGYSISLLK